MKFVRFLLITLFFSSIMPSLTYAGTYATHKINFVPFDGSGSGYKEFQVSPNLYYVSFHGARGNSVERLTFVWKLRAAQLCNESSSTNFIPLRYIFERVVANQMSIDEMISFYQTGAFRKVGGTTYTPIFITASNNRPININAPTINHYVYCIADISLALNKERAISVSETLENGHKQGWLRK